MDQTEQHGTAITPAIALAVCAGICLGVGDAVGFQTDTAESIYICAFLTGWFLLSGAVVLGGGAAISLGYRGLSRRPVTGSEGVLVTITLILIVILIATHPLWGSASGKA